MNFGEGYVTRIQQSWGGSGGYVQNTLRALLNVRKVVRM